jgi:hypothetical protein
MRKMKLSDIKIKESFTKTTPSLTKFADCLKHYDKHKQQDRYIVINHQGELIDGYIQYLVLEYLEIEEAEIVISNRKKGYLNRKPTYEYKEPEYKTQMTTYIWGVHPNNKNKQYIWRVPNSWTEWENDLLPGDMILVNTKFGKKEAIITKIDYLEQCPTEFNVRKVVKKLNKRYATDASLATGSVAM